MENNNGTSSELVNSGLSGLFTGAIITNLWNSQLNPPQIYIENYRIHHGEIGCVITTISFLGLLFSESKEEKILCSYGLCLGSTLILDDIEDRDKWFTGR